MPPDIVSRALKVGVREQMPLIVFASNGGIYVSVQIESGNQHAVQLEANFTQTQLRDFLSECKIEGGQMKEFPNGSCLGARHPHFPYSLFLTVHDVAIEMICVLDRD